MMIRWQVGSLVGALLLAASAFGASDGAHDIVVYGGSPSGLAAAVQAVPDTATAPEAPGILYGTLKFYTKPWAKVYIDGVYKGKTPFVGEAVVQAGRHEIRLENPYCIDLTDTVEIMPETTMVKRYTLDQKAGP